MSRPKLILVGGGGHCKSCIDVVEQENVYDILGILDAPEKLGEKVLGYEIIGSDDDLEKYVKLECYFLISIGQIKAATIRKKIFSKLITLEAKMATVVSPKAYVSKHAQVAAGTIVMHNSFVNAGASIGFNCILNTGSNIEHNATIGNNCHISTGAFINGDCKIGEETFIGSNATISSQIEVGNNVVVGAGGVVVKNLESNQVAVGNPTKAIGK